MKDADEELLLKDGPVSIHHNIHILVIGMYQGSLLPWMYKAKNNPAQLLLTFFICKSNLSIIYGKQVTLRYSQGDI